MKFTAAGDVIIQKRIYEGYEGFETIKPFIMQGDARFFNLETTLNREGETWASQHSGGTYIRTNPDVLEDMKALGFNMTSFNNNHMLDFSYGGLLATIDAVEESGLVHSGVGRNLGEAAAPRYLETKNGRVALIAVNTSFHPALMAGNAAPRVPGRPGINGMRVQTHITLPEKELSEIRRIAQMTNINASREITRQEGYLPPLSDSEAELGEMKFSLGEKAETVFEINPADIKRVEEAIYEAKLQADYILISLHSHQIAGKAKEDVPAFLRDFAHKLIDMGAHAIVGHGPHLLRPIEVYKECPIFYSLGDFILQLYSIDFAPADFFEKHGLDASCTVHDLLRKRSENFTVGLMEDPRMYRAVIPYWETDGTRLKKLSLMPVEGKMNGNKSEEGLPFRSAEKEIFEYISEMSKPYGTKMRLTDDGIIECSW